MHADRLGRVARELDGLSRSAGRAEACCRTARCFDCLTPAQLDRLRDTIEAVICDSLAVAHEVELLQREMPTIIPPPRIRMDPPQHGND